MKFNHINIPRDVVLDVLEEYYKNILESSKDNYMYYKNCGDWEGVNLMENNINLYKDYLEEIKKERRLI